MIYGELLIKIQKSQTHFEEKSLSIRRNPSMLVMTHEQHGEASLNHDVN